MATQVFDVTVKTLMAIEMLRGLLPKKVTDRISSVSEEYMVDRMTVAIKVQFNRGIWSVALLLDDSLSARTWEGDFNKRALNRDEFITNCLMIYEAGDGIDA